MGVFANPLALWLLAVLPVLGMFSAVAWRRRRQALSRLGNSSAIQALVQGRRRSGRWQGLCYIGGVLALIVGIAGPQWGREPNPEAAASGRDLVVVLDLSRSMLAEKPSRQERALRALRSLASTLERHGGHRLALVIFAARPLVLFPLTNDYDHFRAVLNTLDADNLPPELHPKAGDGPSSGTRIGAALRLAVSLHDPRFPGAQDILLLSDGDDPAGDNEWAEGIGPAREAKIPIYCAGFGDPERETPIPFHGDVLRHGNRVVETRLYEKPLQEIARRTGGLYLAARTSVLPLGKIFREVIEPRGERLTSELESTSQLPLPRQRYPWFLGAALALFAGTMLISDRRRSRTRPWIAPVRGIALLAILLVSAAPAAGELLRRGNAAFTAEDYATSVTFYEQAEVVTADPGLVAFNKATALYHLRKYREAELHYRRCLEDQQAPPLRKARAYYDLGNCLLRQAHPADTALLEQAVAAYRSCLAFTVDRELRADAQHNLELATLLLLRARAAAKTSPSQPQQPEDPAQHTAREQRFQKDSRKGGHGEASLEETGQTGEGPDREKMNKKEAAVGKLLSLPDTEDLVPLAAEDVLATLQDAARRILGERRDYRRQAAPVSEKVKDW